MSLPSSRLEVEREAALVAIDAQKIRALTVDERAALTRHVATVGILDLHDVRAQIGELHPAERTRHVVADLEHPNAGQRRSLRHAIHFVNRHPAAFHVGEKALGAKPDSLLSYAYTYDGLKRYMIGTASATARSICA